MRKKKFEGYNNFASVPRYVIDTPAFKSLRGNSVKLLVLLASQYKGNNNGDLIITHSFYKTSFKSSQTMYAARDELEQKGFIATNAYGGIFWNRIEIHSSGVNKTPLNWLNRINFQGYS